MPTNNSENIVLLPELLTLSLDGITGNTMLPKQTAKSPRCFQLTPIVKLSVLTKDAMRYWLRSEDASGVQARVNDCRGATETSAPWTVEGARELLAIPRTVVVAVESEFAHVACTRS